MIVTAKVRGVCRCWHINIHHNRVAYMVKTICYSFAFRLKTLDGWQIKRKKYALGKGRFFAPGTFYVLEKRASKHTFGLSLNLWYKHILLAVRANKL